MADDSRGASSRLTVVIAPWALRTLWVGLLFVAGPALGPALADASGPVRVVATSGLWLGWAGGTVAVAVPHALSLTAIRLLGPAAVACVVAAAAAGHPSGLAIGWSVVTLAVGLSEVIGSRWVNGLAYPNETRHLLRTPAALLAGPLALAWVLLGASVASGPLLLAARAWVWGALALVAGIPLVWVLVRAVHNLSRRWVVFVPAGVVLHDPITLDVPILFPRAQVAGLGPALVDSDTVLDLTQRAAGLCLDLKLNEEATLTLQAPGRRQGRTATTARLRFTPVRPGAVLDEARHRRLPVG